ncbi:hypothetical protein [Photorhabdus luminescens]|uniref:hypothetical protein n=1 Tax=Photorhabdus luminescens TaxID=29488 RepID=UPI0022407DF0|nr:hypothetical protein [Photorhabdus luminescens]MCW7763688.1 hypothetical protein [Photorhabdus luminescens subsp. venezuelensis]
MPKLIYYVAATMDGYIANENNELDWLYTQWISRCIVTVRGLNRAIFGGTKVARLSELRHNRAIFLLGAVVRYEFNDRYL